MSNKEKDPSNRASDDEYVKPKVFRDRSKKKELPPLAEREHPRHKPYERDRLNHLLDDWDNDQDDGN